MSQAANDSGFSEAQERALACVLDEIIPPSEDGRFPGAGELGLVSYVRKQALEALGLEARPPFPEGHEIEPNDHSLLDPVRARGPVYRF